MKSTRRKLLLSLVTIAPAVTLMSTVQAEPLDNLRRALTPACDDSDEMTPEQTEGPYYRPSSPYRYDLSSDAPGATPFALTGLVLDQDCRPLREVIVEIWHADQNGNYDNQGFRFRAHQVTDSNGRWAFLTILTQHYAFRTAHYHVRVQRPDGDVLTTQLYFPDHPRNGSDPLFNPRLVMQLNHGTSFPFGRYDFVV
jgi:protocatechuate 3,4-dioxygenase beta subunit